MTYFEMLSLAPDTTDEETIDAAYTQARIKWQTVLNQGTGEQQRLAREMMNGALDEAYDQDHSNKKDSVAKRHLWMNGVVVFRAFFEKLGHFAFDDSGIRAQASQRQTGLSHIGQQTLSQDM